MVKKIDIIGDYKLAIARKEYIERGLAQGKTPTQLYKASVGTKISQQKQTFFHNVKIVKGEPIEYQPKYTPKKYELTSLKTTVNPNPQQDNFQYWIKYKVRLNQIVDSKGKPIIENRFTIVNSKTKLTRSQVDKLSQSMFKKGTQTFKKRKGKKGKNYMDFTIISTPVVTQFFSQAVKVKK